MLDTIINVAIYAVCVVAGAVIVPLYPPLFRLAEKIRAKLDFKPGT